MNKKREQKETEKLKQLKTKDTDIGQVFRVLDNGRFEAMFCLGRMRPVLTTCRIPVNQVLKGVSIMPGDIVSVDHYHYRWYEPQLVHKYSYDEATLLKKVGELPQHVTLNNEIY
uniref:eukaryotic translation initiation factor 1A-like n=1 Tax=Erigeron canadensis TaxID=72917 RepID=UPI001CB8E61E|nr:eukaryotic translation initiation factor 1A-like [Erigeron canadensis]